MTTPSTGPGMNMALRAHLDLQALTGTAGASGSGNWGFTHSSGRRFALTGTSLGLSVVEVSDPRSPRNVGFVPGARSQWREVRTYGDYAYVTTEAQSGLDIVSLRDPDHPAKIQTWSRTLASAHTITIDTDRGLAFVNGCNGRTGGMRVLDLAGNPEDPDEVGSFADFYIHDGYVRGTTFYASAINDGFEALLDASNPGGVHEVTRFFTGGRFTHNSWLTGDGRYLFTTDERLGRPLEGWDLLNPMQPRKVSEYIASPNSIAHNVMIDRDRLLVAHYTEGVHLLNVRDPEHPTVMGFYDTYTDPPCAAFPFCGVWGAYQFPGSNLIVASDIQGGLFVLEYTGP